MEADLASAIRLIELEMSLSSQREGKWRLFST
jgi:hypothetical protein